MPPSPLQSASTRQTRRHATTHLPFSTGNGVRSPPYPTRHRLASPLSTHPEQILAITGRKSKASASGATRLPSPSVHTQNLSSASEEPSPPSGFAISRYGQDSREETTSTSRQPPPQVHVSPPNDSDTADDISSVGSPPSPFGAISSLSDVGPITPAASMQDSSASALAVTSPMDDMREDSPISPSDTDVALPPTNVKPRTIKSLKSNPPRPPNAWILYRSEKLKAIAAGEKLANLEAILAEQAAEARRAQEGASRAPGGSGKQRGVSQTSSKSSKSSGKGKKRLGDKDTESEPTDDRSPPQDSAGISDGNTGSKAVPQAEISKVISLMWKREKKEEKARFEKMAQAKKAEHALKYPDYKFQPMKKEERQRLKEEMQEERLRARQEVLDERARSRKKASKVKPTIAMVEAGELPAADFAEPSSGPAVKKPRKARAKKTSTPWTTTPRPAWGSEIPLDDIAQPHGFAPTYEADSMQTYRPVLPPFPEGLAQNISLDAERGPSHGSYGGVFVGPPSDGPQNYWQIQAASGPPPLNYYPAPNSEAFQALPQPSASSMDPSFRQGVQFAPYPPSYAGQFAPMMHPGFAVENGEVVPYIFEPMPFGMGAPEMQNPPLFDGPSNRSEPAIGTMGPVECQPLGVSEAELAEMWALLQEDAVEHSSGNVGEPSGMSLGEPWGGNPEAAVDAWSQFGMPVNEPEEQEIPLSQLSGPVVSHIANDWASYDNSPASGLALATPVSRPRSNKVSGYTAPGAFYEPPGSSPQIYQPGSSITPKYIKVQLPSGGSPGPSALSEAMYQGPPLSSQGALSPLSPPSDPAPVDFRNSAPYHQESSRQQIGRRNQDLPSPPIQYRRVSSQLPTPQTSGFFGNQLTPPAYHMPPAGFSGSRHSSMSGEPYFPRLPEDDRTGEGYRVPSFAFADAGRVLSGISSNGAFVDKDTAYNGTPYYRDFSFSSGMSRSASVTTTMSAERENRDGR